MLARAVAAGHRVPARGAGCVVSTAMDVDELRHALGGVVLEAAYLERVLRTAFSGLVGSKYASVVDDRLTVATLVEDCERIARHHTDIPGPVRVVLLEAFKSCHEANRERNRVIHDAWAARPGDVTVTLAGGRNARDVTVTVRTPAEVRQVAERLAAAADEVRSALTAALGPGWVRVEGQLRQELGRSTDGLTGRP